MANLIVNTGAVEYNINGAWTITFNPADPMFATKLTNVFIELDPKDKEWREKIREAKEPKDSVKLYIEGERIFREAIDSIIGVGGTNAICGASSSLLALADGQPVWVNIILALIEQMDEAVLRECKVENPKLKKYLSKYGR